MKIYHEHQLEDFKEAVSLLKYLTAEYDWLDYRVMRRAIGELELAIDNDLYREPDGVGDSNLG